jgi:uncharacterized protein YdeI (YjbR/CyaY-like superfamily)
MVQIERDVDVPEDFAEALRKAPTAAAKWDTLSYGHKRAHVSSIMKSKEAEARARRIEETIEHLLEE